MPTNVLLELRDGQQLEAEDIEKAIHDSTIRPVPLYSSLDKPVAAQLYFGPGFEDRLEMEMEELASKRKRLSPEELEIRKQEDELFRKLQEAPPAFDGFQNVLDEEEDAAGKQRMIAVKRLFQSATRRRKSNKLDLGRHVLFSC